MSIHSEVLQTFPSRRAALEFSSGRRRLAFDIARLDQIDGRIGLFAEKLDPLLLETTMVFRRFHEMHETASRIFEALL